jgi:hypothetical protein
MFSAPPPDGLGPTLPVERFSMNTDERIVVVPLSKPTIAPPPAAENPSVLGTQNPHEVAEEGTSGRRQSFDLATIGR